MHIRQSSFVAIMSVYKLLQTYQGTMTSTPNISVLVERSDVEPIICKCNGTCYNVLFLSQSVFNNFTESKCNSICLLQAKELENQEGPLP